MTPALGLLEFSSIATGIVAGDAMAKRAPIDALYAGTVHPGRYLVMVRGDTASVEEALAAGIEVGEASLLDTLFLPDVHDDVVDAVTGTRRRDTGEALGVIETRTVSAVLEAADAAVKGAVVTLAIIRMADGLGGKGYALFVGSVADVEASVEIGVSRLEGSGQLVASVVIPQLSAEMAENLDAAPGFVARAATARGAD